MRGDQQDAAHDTAGYETEFVDLGQEYQDGYGNNVAAGDLTIQKEITRDRGRWPEPKVGKNGLCESIRGPRLSQTNFQKPV